MFLRSAAVACITALMASVALPAAAETTCDATNVRVYFEHGSDALSPMAMDTLNAAARSMEGCDRAELRIAVDASDMRASRRAEAIRTAAAGQGWDAITVEPRMMTRVAMSSSPDFVTVTMSPDPLPAPAAMPNAPGVGV
jgi:hypothetical protein